MMIRKQILDAIKNQDQAALVEHSLKDALQTIEKVDIKDVYAEVLEFILAINDEQSELTYEAERAKRSESRSAEWQELVSETRKLQLKTSEERGQAALKIAQYFGELKKDPFIAVPRERYGILDAVLTPYFFPLSAYFGDNDPGLVVREEYEKMFCTPKPNDIARADEDRDLEKCFSHFNLVTFIEHAVNRHFVDTVYEATLKKCEPYLARVLSYVYAQSNADYSFLEVDREALLKSVFLSNESLLVCLEHGIGLWGDRDFIRVFFSKLKSLPMCAEVENKECCLPEEALDKLEQLTPPKGADISSMWRSSAEDFVEAYTEKYTGYRRNWLDGKALHTSWAVGDLLDSLSKIASLGVYDFAQGEWDECWKPDLLMFLAYYYGDALSVEEHRHDARYAHDLTDGDFEEISKVLSLSGSNDKDISNSEDARNVEEEVEDSILDYSEPKFVSAGLLQRIMRFILEELLEEGRDRLAASLIAFWLFVLVYRTRGRLRSVGSCIDDYSFILRFVQLGLGGKHRKIIETSVRRSVLICKQFGEDGNADRLRQFLPTEEEELLALIEYGESASVEFKETVRWDVRKEALEDKSKHISQEWMKTVTAFLNTAGGVVLVGVADNKEIKGINYKKEQFSNDDKLLLWVKDLIISAMGAPVMSFVDLSITYLEGKRVLRMDCRKSKLPVFVKYGRFEDDALVRIGPSSKRLTTKEFHDFWASRDNEVVK